MPYTVHIDEKFRILLVRFETLVTANDFESLHGDMLVFAQRHGNRDAIVDFTAVTSFTADVGYMRAIGRRPRVMKGARRVLVAPQPEIFGLSRMYGLHQSDASGEEPMIVHTLDEACTFLELEAPQFIPLVL
jgi:hypothetical protein